MAGIVEIFNIVVAVLGVLMSLGHFPQAIKILKRKSAKDVSLITYFIFMVGAYVWLAYGILIDQMPMIASFLIAVAGTTTVFVLILKYR